MATVKSVLLVMGTSLGLAGCGHANGANDLYQSKVDNSPVSAVSAAATQDATTATAPSSWAAQPLDLHDPQLLSGSSADQPASATSSH